MTLRHGPALRLTLTNGRKVTVSTPDPEAAVRAIERAFVVTIPVLSFRADGFVDDLRDVCHRVGFFQLVDHGIEARFFDDHFGAIAEFFALPLDVKATIDKRNSPHFRGGSASAPN